MLLGLMFLRCLTWCATGIISDRPAGLLEPFFLAHPDNGFRYFYPFESMKIHHECEGGIEKSVSRITN